MNDAPAIPGADKVVDWFGGWPTFHDAEILEICLRRKGVSCLRLHAWIMTDQLDAKGYYVLEKHAVVTFFLEGVTDVELSGFSGQNVINGLKLEKAVSSLLLSFDPSYGLGGAIEATKVSVDLTPGEPKE